MTNLDIESEEIPLLRFSSDNQVTNSSNKKLVIKCLLVLLIIASTALFLTNNSRFTSLWTNATGWNDGVRSGNTIYLDR